MRLLPLTAIAAGLFTLSACTDEPAPGSGADAADAVSAPAAQKAGAPVSPADLPRLRPGLWRTTTAIEGEDEDVITQCVGPDQPFEAPGGGEAQTCTDAYSRSATGIRLLRRCSQNGVETVMRGEITGDFQSRSAMDLEMQLTIPGQPAPLVRRLRSASTYLGACEAGQEPGVISDGL